jgi:hypothetical protein
MPEQLEQIMFEERIARTTMGKTTAQEMCIRGCTDRKVSLHGEEGGGGSREREWDSI